MIFKLYKPLLALIPIVFLSQSVLANWEVSSAERNELLKRAQVWKNPGNVAEKDMATGGGKKYSANQVLQCTFYDSYYKELVGTGATPKFWCVEEGKNPETDFIKIKYGQTNGEVFAEVVSSRLMWALGFFTDKVYPISVDCKNCPSDPWAYLKKLSYYKRYEDSTFDGQQNARDSAADYIVREQKNRAQRNKIAQEKTGQMHITKYDVAMTESKFDGKGIYLKGSVKASLSLKELALISEIAGGASLAEIDALRLLLAFIEHGDNKAENQRLACPEKMIIKDAEGKITGCEHAAIVIQDVGATIGNGATSILGLGAIKQDAKLAYQAWKANSVWADQSKCIARLNKSANGTMGNTKISEAGRKFLADLMVQLTDRQINDLFTAARVELRQGVPKAEVVEWVNLFKLKRDEILNTKCTE